MTTLEGSVSAQPANANSDLLGNNVSTTNYQTPNYASTTNTNGNMLQPANSAGGATTDYSIPSSSVGSNTLNTTSTNSNAASAIPGASNMGLWIPFVSQLPTLSQQTTSPPAMIDSTNPPQDISLGAPPSQINTSIPIPKPQM
ncbi:MAG: hypothetical protein QXL94_02870 [Candidatus Parvarchaeum sp.]